MTRLHAVLFDARFVLGVLRDVVADLTKEHGR